MMSRSVCVVGVVAILAGCRDDARDCAELATKTANETLDEALFSVFKLDEHNQSVYRETFQKELCTCVVPKLNGQSIKSAIDDKQPFLTECARDAGEAASKAAFHVDGAPRR